VTVYRGSVRVRRTTFRGFGEEKAVEVASGVSYTEAYCGGIAMVSKWIAAAVTSQNKVTSVRKVDEPVLFKDRPALKDFMVELEGEKGKPREPSVLMIAVSADGMRVGLKDEGAGGWLWREATDLAGCLDAIEKALQGGNVVWAVPGGRGGRKR
jgi:hypothetical protein